MRRRPGPVLIRGLDLTLVLAALVVGVWRETADPQAQREARLVLLPVGVYVTVQVIGALVLLARRRHPVGVAVVLSALNLLSPTQASLLAAYSLGAQGGLRARPLTAFGALLLTWCLGATLWTLADPVSGPLLLLALLLLGLYLRSRRALLDALEERAVRAERERDLLAERAVAAERARIAREMHDAIAHRVSLMVLQAGALGVASADPQVRLAAEGLRASGARTLEDIAAVVGVLRSGDGRTGGHPGAAGSVPSAGAPARLEDLLAGARRSGQRVHARIESEGEGDRPAPAAARAVHRVVQEALTNAAKYAGHSTVRLTVSREGGGTAVLVVNDLAADVAVAPAGTGSGLVGLRERLDLLGGRFDSGAAEDRTFVVRAWVPDTVDADGEGSAT